jgi:hypothetical protein
VWPLHFVRFEILVLNNFPFTRFTSKQYYPKELNICHARKETEYKKGLMYFSGWDLGQDLIRKWCPSPLSSGQGP